MACSLDGVDLPLCLLGLLLAPDSAQVCPASSPSSQLDGLFVFSAPHTALSWLCVLLSVSVRLRAHIAYPTMGLAHGKSSRAVCGLDDLMRAGWWHFHNIREDHMLSLASNLSWKYWWDVLVTLSSR